MPIYSQANYLETISQKPLQLTGRGTQLLVTNNALFGSINVTTSATIGSLVLSGVSQVTTAPLNDNSTTIASTAFVNNAIANIGSQLNLSNYLTIVNATATYAPLFCMLRIVTASGNVTQSASDQIIIVNKATPAVTTVNLLSSPATGQMLQVKDGAGNASSYNITIVPASGTIDGSSSIVMNNNYASVTLVYNGSGWNIL
jgi:hypothetical protein